MKKIYINPTMTVVKVKTQSLLELSQPGVKISTEASDAVDAASVESRSSSLWDDEDE